jgi:hypothetical protein
MFRLLLACYSFFGQHRDVKHQCPKATEVATTVQSIRKPTADLAKAYRGESLGEEIPAKAWQHFIWTLGLRLPIARCLGIAHCSGCWLLRRLYFSCFANEAFDNSIHVVGIICDDQHMLRWLAV